MIIGKGVDKVFQLLADLQHSKVEIVKTGYNKFGSYEYATKDDILKAINPFLKKHGCIVMWSEESHEHTQRENKDGSTYWMHTDSIVKCRIQALSGVEDYVEGTSHGYGINKNSDKTLKARTIAERYALTGLLGIPSVSEDDVDASHSDVRGQEQSTPKEVVISNESFAERTRRKRATSVDSKRSASNLLM